MNFYTWESAIDRDECEAIIKEYKDSNFTTAQIGLPPGNTSKFTVDPSIRKADIIWIDPKRLITRAIWGFVEEANNSFFNYSINGFESIQFGRYGVGGYYEWHTDSTDIDPQAEQVRKLSVTVQLSDPDSYEGGEFQFFDGCKRECVPKIQKQGSVIVFDSSNWHRITPVTKGVRYSVVMWAAGANFK